MSNLFRTLQLLVFVIGLGGGAALPAEVWLDDFEDGAWNDGLPYCSGGGVCWISACNPGRFEIVCGDLEIENSNPGWTAGFGTKRVFRETVSARTQVRFVRGRIKRGVSDCFAPCVLIE